MKQWSVIDRKSVPINPLGFIHKPLCALMKTRTCSLYCSAYLFFLVIEKREKEVLSGLVKTPKGYFTYTSINKVTLNISNEKPLARTEDSMGTTLVVNSAFTKNARNKDLRLETNKFFSNPSNILYSIQVGKSRSVSPFNYR